MEVITDGLQEAIAAAEASEVAVVVVGNNPLINGRETSDRPDLTLADSQEKLIQEVSRVNPNTIVVVIGSYPFAINGVEERRFRLSYICHMRGKSWGTPWRMYCSAIITRRVV